MSPLTSAIVKNLVEDELLRAPTFTNYHGITPANIRLFLVEPFTVLTDPDDLETQPRDMWVVLQERSSLGDGYSVVYDPQTCVWAVVQATPEGNYTALVSASSLAEALSSV